MGVFDQHREIVNFVNVCSIYIFVFKTKNSLNRAEQVKPEPTVPSTVTQKEPESLCSTPTHADDSYKHCGNYDEDNDEGPLHNPEKDDMLARRTGSYQKPSGNQFNAFLPKPGGVRSKKKNVSGQCEPNLTIGEQPTQRLGRKVHECGFHNGSPVALIHVYPWMTIYKPRNCLDSEITGD